MILTKQEIMVCDKLLPSGRKYTNEILLKIKEILLKSSTTSFGELNHGEASVLDLSKVSHKVLNPQIENNTLFVDVEILSTPSGKILSTLKDHVVFRPRGFGNINEQTFEIENFELLSIDAVPATEDTLF